MDVYDGFSRLEENGKISWEESKEYERDQEKEPIAGVVVKSEGFLHEQLVVVVECTGFGS